ncbi:hypothetical protein Tsubulata_001212, partial [Turnera subulata]
MGGGGVVCAGRWPDVDTLSGVATFEQVPLSCLADGKIQSVATVLLHSLAYLPHAAQHRLRPYQIILCLGSSDRSGFRPRGRPRSPARPRGHVPSQGDRRYHHLGRTHLLSRHRLSMKNLSYDALSILPYLMEKWEHLEFLGFPRSSDISAEVYLNTTQGCGELTYLAVGKQCTCGRASCLWELGVETIKLASHINTIIY